MQEEKKGFSKWFSELFSENKKEAEVQEQEPAIQATPEPPPPPQVRVGPKWTLEPHPEGATSNLLNLWNSESGMAFAMRASIALDRMPEGRDCPLTDSQLGSEVNRLRIGLESKSAARLKQVREQTQKNDGVCKLPAECIVHVALNGMMAWMLIYPPVGGGSELSVDLATTAVRRVGVTTGVETEHIKRLVEGLLYFKLVPIAWGNPPREGEDGRILDYFPREQSRALVMDAGGNVDYREQSYVRTLHKEDVICDIIPPQPGLDGIQVTGKVVKARPTQPARPPMGKNTAISPDGLHMIATVDGHLEFTGKAFQVRPILEISGDVDYSSGNINFFGDVHISGDVRENFTVRATGSVTIDGLVEAATVIADGNIIITRGVLGDNKAMIRSRKTVRAKYLENCVVYAGESVFADCIISSQVYADSRISVLTGRGTIIGGCVSAAELVEAAVIGSNAGRRTEIILGRMPNVEQERTTNAVEIKDLYAQLEEIGRQIPYLEQRQDSPENAKLLGKLRLDKSVKELKLEKLSRRMVELDEMTPDLSTCRLRCGTVLPVANVTIGNGSRIINTTWVNCMAYYNEERREIVFTSG